MRHGSRSLGVFFSSCNRSTSLSTQTSISPPSDIGDLLLSAAFLKSFQNSPAAGGSRFPLDSSSLPSPFPDSALLRLLRLQSLSADAKLSIFNLVSSLPAFSPSQASFSALLLSLSRTGRLADLPDLLRLALSSSKVDPKTFASVIAAFVHADLYDLAISALDDAVAILDSAAAAKLLTSTTYSSIILALLRKSQLDLALPMFQKLLGSSAELDARACNQLLLALRKADMRDEFRKVFDELSRRGYPFDSRGYNICIHAFGSWGHLGLALKLFKEMKPDICTYNSLLGALCAGGKVADAMAAYEEMKGSGHEPDRFTYQTLILACSKSFRIDEAMHLFREMEYNCIKADTLTYNTLLDGLLKVRKLSEACQLFEKMISDGVRASCYSYNILIDGLFRNGRPAAAFALFTELKKKKGQFVDGITYSIVISRLCKEDRVSEALDLVKEMEERGFAVDLVTITSLLIGFHKNGRWDSAERLVKYVRDSVLLPNVLRWEENVEASLESPQDKSKDYTPLFPSVGNLTDVMSLIEPNLQNVPGDSKSDKDLEDGWSSSPYLDKLAGNFKSTDDLNQFFAMNRGQRVEEKGMAFDTGMLNTYLSIFLSDGKLSIACKLFEMFTSMGNEPVSYTYNSLLSSFVKKGYLNDAWGILQEMGNKNCQADIATFNLIIQGLGKMGRCDIASFLLDWLSKNGGYIDTVMYNTVINALGKAGRVDEANGLFKKMTAVGINPDVFTFNTLIEVNSKAGRVKEAYKFLRKMLAAGCMPNHVTDSILDYLEKEIEKIRLQKASIIMGNEGEMNSDIVD
ncbi:Pentatricopeptide repeat-containing protein [Apostasia shenzhenica]|uniref:Pentatricopeptide repeat-containing protein n=1 Tax=Apostasia shenzhenica TaxID=1088818 RepID=A0A2I0A9K9_9ASPA|nr:Pentatricopeptide repeat-containing protein [Apostasia shenzhenica]